MMEHSKTSLLNELTGVVLHNVIYYVPSEIVVEGALAQIESDIPDSFFDELNLFDIDKGIFEISNKDTLEINQRLLDKRLQLEENIFKLEAEKKQLEPVAFEIVIQKYYAQLFFTLYIAQWLILNLKKYHKGKLNLSLIGSFKLQFECLKNHLNDIESYFEKCIDLEKEYYFTSEALVMEYFPDLIARLNQIENNRMAQNTDQTSVELEPITKKNWNPDKPVKKKKVKKKRPIISDEKIEMMILKSVFNVKIMSEKSNETY